eukprot:ANDGO_06927.mRNA.1 Protein arginine N-methyltransferase 5
MNKGRKKESSGGGSSGQAKGESPSLQTTKGKSPKVVARSHDEDVEDGTSGSAAVATASGGGTAHPTPFVGLDVPSVSHLGTVLDSAIDSSFDFIAIPISHPRNRHFADEWRRSTQPMTRSDKELPSRDWSSYILGRTSEWIQFSSADANVRKVAEDTLNAEIAWAAHLNLQAVILPTPSAGIAAYGRIVLENLLKSRSGMFFYVPIPVVLHAHAIEDLKRELGMESIADDGDVDWAWLMWNRIRTECDFNANLAVALVLTAEVPACSKRLERWLAEPVRTLVIPSHIFLPNKKGFPVLAKKHQQIILQFLPFQPNVLLTGKPCHVQASSMVSYGKYIDHLHKGLPLMTEMESFEAPFADYLQSPLQPLADHLESSTYEVFERDPIKYKLYEDAVFSALTKNPSLSQRGKIVEDRVTIMVVGAGRGPLVRASLSGAARAKCKVRVIAVEKNPNAIITLRNEAEDLDWEGQVEIVHSDMRLVDPSKYSTDILVSELLGSFGDNELSPECLDGAQRLLKMPHGISIPCSSTSFLAPVSTHKIWSECRSFVLSGGPFTALETPYVVKMKRFFLIDEPKRCFHYIHPNPHLLPKSEEDVNNERASLDLMRMDDTGQTVSPTSAYPKDNDRSITLSFTATSDALMHGLAGFFESRLFEEIFYGILPSRHSPGLISWFPIFFPLRVPIPVTKGTIIKVCMWRRSSATKVWYEWAIDAPRQSTIHNPNGRSYWIGKY